MQIRHFLERSNTPAEAIVAEGIHLLVVIDHREARIYKAELHGSIPERIVPYDPDGYLKHYSPSVSLRQPVDWLMWK